MLRALAFPAANMLVWLAIPAALAWRGPDRAAVRRAMRAAAGMAAAAAMPMLLLPWQSPGHLYLVLFGTAIGAGLLVSASPHRQSPLRHLLTAAVIGAGLVVFSVAARHRILDWGPLTRQIIADWRAQRAPEDRRVIFFDPSWREPHGGLAELIGPGIRLHNALELVTGERLPGAAICVDLVVGPAYQQQPGDALFVVSGGRLSRVGSPPFPHATCLP